MAADLYPMGRLEIDHASRYRLGSTEVASRDRRVRLTCLARGCQVRRVRQVRLVRRARPGRSGRLAVVRLGRSGPPGAWCVGSGWVGPWCVGSGWCGWSAGSTGCGGSAWAAESAATARVAGKRRTAPTAESAATESTPTAESTPATESAAAAESATAAESASTAPTCTAWTAGYAEVDETSRGSMTAGPSGFALRRSAGSVGAATLSPWRLDARRGARHT